MKHTLELEHHYHQQQRLQQQQQQQHQRQQEKWTRKKVKSNNSGKKCPWTGPAQFEDPSGKLMMLPSDLVLTKDAKFNEWVVK